MEWALKIEMEQRVLSWWQVQAGKYGFRLEQDKKSNYPVFQSSAYQWNALPEKDRKAGYSSLDLTGKISVTNIKLFQGLLKGGIGKSKAFGCGLVMIQRSFV